jgi:TolA-binding protein
LRSFRCSYKGKTKNLLLAFAFICGASGCATPQVSGVAAGSDEEALRLFLQAQSLSQEGRLEEAVAKYREVVRRSQSLAPSARLQIGIVVENQSDSQLSGRRMRERLIPVDGSFLDLELDLHWSRAIGAYREVVTSHSGTHEAAVALYRMGLIYMDRVRDYPKAMEHFKTIVSAYQNDELAAGAQFKMGEIRYRVSDFEGALKELANIRLRHPESQLVERADKMVKFIRSFSSENRPALSSYAEAEENYRQTRYNLAASFYDEALGKLSGDKSGNKELRDFAEELAYYSGESYYRSGDIERASDRFKSYLDGYPDGRFKSEASIRIADINLAHRGGRLRAIQRYNDYLSRAADDRAADAYFKIGYAYAEGGGYPEAADSFLEAKRRYQANVDSYKSKMDEVKKRLSESQINEQQKEELVGQLGELEVKIEHDRILSVESGYKAGEAYHASGDYKKSLAEYQNVLRNYRHRQRFKESQVRVAYLLYKSGRYEEAISAYLWSAIDFPNDPAYYEALFFIGKSYLWLGEVQKALSYFRALTGTGSENPYAARAAEEINFVADNFSQSEEDAFKLYLEALNYYEQRNYSLALEGFRKVSSRYPKSRVYDDALVWEGRSLSSIGETDKALLAYGRAIASSGDREIKIGAYLSMADVLLKDKIDMGGGADIYRRMIREYPDDYRVPLLHFKIASYYKDEGFYQQAVEEYKNALDNHRRQAPNGKLDGEFIPRARMALGEAYYSQGDYEKALQEYEMVKSDYPNTSFAPDALFKIGNVYLLTKKYEESIGAYERLINLYPDSLLASQAQFQKGSIYDLYLRKFKEAVREYRRLVELYPDSPLAPQAQYNIGYIYQFKMDEGTLEEEIRRELHLAN